jgi:hypothetical protein
MYTFIHFKNISESERTALKQSQISVSDVGIYLLSLY